MAEKRKFRIGQVVEVNLNDRLKADYDRGEYRRVARVRDWHGHDVESNELVLAIITGVKVFREGQYCAGDSNRSIYRPDDDYDPPYLSVKENVTAWAVRLGYKNKEIYFFEEDIKSKEVHYFFDQYICFPKEDIPYFYNSWNDRYRQQMSRESKDWPRDAKGRWSK
jgi:hypothetical protein